MAENNSCITAYDGQKIYMRHWLPKEPKAVVVLAHGMTEHSQRYDGLGQYLTQHGIGLVCHDQRGHGVTALQTKTLGHLPINTGWAMMIADIQQIIDLVKQQYQCPVFLMGHSMGSFLVRRTIQLTPNIADGLILSGTGGDPGIAGQIGLTLAWARCEILGEKDSGAFLQKLNFGHFNNQFKPTKTEFDWLCSDEQVVNDYINDPLCGFTCTNGFFYELYRNVRLVNQEENNRHLPHQLPVYLFSGGLDPVGDMGKGVNQVYMQYKRAGIADLTIKLYPDSRHEVLNENIKQDVYQDLLLWLMNHIK